MKKLTAKVLFVSSFASYVISLFVPAFYDGRSRRAWLGLAALISGVFGAIAGYVCWFANPLIVVVWVAALAKRRRVVIWGGAFACALCLSFLAHDSVLDGVGPTPIVGLGPGFWLWTLAPLLMTIYGLLMPESERGLGESDQAREDGSIHGDAAGEA